MNGKLLIAIAFAAAWGLSAATDATAQGRTRPACGDRAEILAQLNGVYDEKPTAFGTTGDGAVVELTTSRSGTWTMILSLPNGQSCLMATGEDWEQWPQLFSERES